MTRSIVSLFLSGVVLIFDRLCAIASPNGPAGVFHSSRGYWLCRWTIVLGWGGTMVESIRVLWFRIWMVRRRSPWRDSFVEPAFSSPDTTGQCAATI